MTEDDTFNALRRRPLEQVHHEFYNGMLGAGLLALHRHLVKNKWSLKEYLNYHFDTYEQGWVAETKEEWIERLHSEYVTELHNQGIEVSNE